MLLGLSGYAQSGKDTIGQALVRNYGFTRYAFADVLKEVVYRLNPVADIGDVRVQEIVDDYGWEEAKNISEVRRLLQVMGTEAGRDVLGTNIWVDTVLNRVRPTEDVVITDCRFPNEAQAVKNRGGHVVRVVRAGVDAANDHPSETSLDTWPFDMVVDNNGTLEDVDWIAESVYSTLKSDHQVLQLF